MSGYIKKYGEVLAERDGGWNCHYCGVALVRLHKGDTITPDAGAVDHIIPRGIRLGDPDDRLDNLVLSCFRCNSKKRLKPYTSFKK